MQIKVDSQRKAAASGFMKSPGAIDISIRPRAPQVRGPRRWCDTDALAGLFGTTAFTLVATYAAVFHTTRWLAITWLATGATLVVMAIRLAATDVAFAFSAVLLVAFIVVFVSLTGRVTISLVDFHILH